MWSLIFDVLGVGCNLRYKPCSDCNSTSNLQLLAQPLCTTHYCTRDCSFSRYIINVTRVISPFITGQYPQINDDLVNSHHLLLCCMDMLFCAAVAGKRRDLLNPDCPLLPQDFASPNFVSSDDKMCVLTELSEKYGGIIRSRVCWEFFYRHQLAL